MARTLNYWKGGILRQWLREDHMSNIHQKIHELYQTLYNFLKTTKDKKLKELINDQKQDPIDANQAISTPINNIKNTPNFQ